MFESLGHGLTQLDLSLHLIFADGAELLGFKRELQAFLSVMMLRKDSTWSLRLRLRDGLRREEGSFQDFFHGPEGHVADPAGKSNDLRLNVSVDSVRNALLN